MNGIENGGSDYTTISLRRDFKEELEKNMSWGMSFQDYLKSELDINYNEDDFIMVDAGAGFVKAQRSENQE